MHLRTGWQCTRICHVCTADNWHDPRETAPWNTNGPGQTPYKDGPSSPLLGVPGCNLPHHTQLDFCHCFHLGYGIDMAASTIVLLAKLNFFGTYRSLNEKLKVAYGQFSAWCAKNHRVTSITRFSKLDFDMTLTLSFVYDIFFDFFWVIPGHKFGKSLSTITSIDLGPSSSEEQFLPSQPQRQSV